MKKELADLEVAMQLIPRTNAIGVALHAISAALRVMGTGEGIKKEVANTEIQIPDVIEKDTKKK